MMPWETALALGSWSLHSHAFVLKKAGVAQRVVANTTDRTNELIASTAFTVLNKNYFSRALD
jgi:hypothetical protein